MDEKLIKPFSRSMSVSVIGAGPTGCSFAADLSSRGHKVLIYSHCDHPGALPMIEQNDSYLDAGELVNGLFKVVISNDIRDAVMFSNYLVVTVPSYGHITILEELNNFDLHEHCIIASPGNYFARTARKMNINAKIIFETSTAPFATRIQDGKVLVKGVKYHLPISGLPMTHSAWLPKSKNSLKIRRDIERIFPKPLDWYDNVMMTGLANIGAVVHPAAAIMNTARIESTKGDFYFYREGMSSSVCKFIKQIDMERRAIAKAYGFHLPSLESYLETFYGQGFDDFETFIEQTRAHNLTKGAPADMHHRYITEDVAFVLVVWYQLGLKVGIEATNIKSVIIMSGTVNGTDYLKSGRNLEVLGLEHASKRRILSAFGDKQSLLCKLVNKVSTAI